MCWVWSLLSAGIAAGYLAVTAWLGALLRTRTGPAVSPVAVACVAIAFEPVRSCRPRSADRLVYGGHRDPLAVLGDVAARLTRPRNDRSGWEQGPWSRSTARGRLGCCRSPCTSPGMLFPPAGY